jgi:hypothetical protein
LGFVPGGSYLAVRSYKSGAALSPHTVDLGVRVLLAEAQGRGHAFGSGGLPIIGCPPNATAFPAGLIYPRLRAILDNGADLATLTAGAAKLVLACRPVTL